MYPWSSKEARPNKGTTWRQTPNTLKGRNIMYITIRHNAKLDTYIVSAFYDEQKRAGVIHVTDEDKIGNALKHLESRYGHPSSVECIDYVGFDYLPENMMHCALLVAAGEEVLV
nr:MAG TPA: hypothetical protein [Caudoviricetes sp.]